MSPAGRRPVRSPPSGRALTESTISAATPRMRSTDQNTGSVLAVIFPVGLIVGATIGDVSGAVAGHIRHGLKREDVKELGDIIDDGQAALIIVGESKLQDAIDKAALKAEKHVAKELNVSKKDVDQAVQEAATEVS